MQPKLMSPLYLQIQSWMRSSSLQVQSSSKHSLSQVNKDGNVATVAPFVMPADPQTAQLSKCRHCGKLSSQPSPAVIHTVGPHSVTFSTCGVQLKDCCIPLLLDTGAKVSLLNMATYKTFFSDVELQPSPLKLCGYGQASISVTGVVKLPVQYGQKRLPEFPFYITKLGANILGLDLFLSLDFSLHDNNGATILQVDSPWQTQFPALFSGLGCLSAFSHKPLLNPAQVSHHCSLT